MMGHQIANRVDMVNNQANIEYLPLLILYTILFSGLCIWIYDKKGTKQWAVVGQRNDKGVIFILLVVAFLMRVTLATAIQGYASDLALFRSWATAAASDFSNFYTGTTNCDYPPLYIYILAIIGKLTDIQVLNNYYILLLKLPSILADITTALVLYQLAKRTFSSQFSILLMTFYVFNPATFLNSAVWGQVDSFFTFLVVLAFYFLAEKKTNISTLFFVLSVLMKPQGIIFTPILFFELVRAKSVKKFLTAALVGVATVALIVLPFSYQHGSVWIFELYSSTISKYPYASMNAFNLFSLIGANFTNYNEILLFFSYHTWGMIFIVLVTALSWFLYGKKKNSDFVFAAGLTQIAGVFIFSVGMHERYLFPAIAMAIFAFIYLKDRNYLVFAGGFSITCFINTYCVLVYGLQGGMNSAVESSPLMAGLTALMNVVLFGYLVKVNWNNIKKGKVCTDE